MAGSFERERRDMRKLAWVASRAGWLAQVDPRKQPSIDKLVGDVRPRRAMSAAEVVMTMRAWASATREG